MINQFRTLRRSQRPPCRDLQDQRNAALIFSLVPEEFQALQRAAKTWDVTLNDIFLALLLQALAQARPRPESTARRTKLAVGCIVNLRKELGITSSQIFGLFLGSFVVTCEPQSGAASALMGLRM